MLPTEKRYKDLTLNQKILMFECFCQYPTVTAIKQAIDTESYKNKFTINEENVNKEDIEALKGWFDKWGMDLDTVNEHIKQVIDNPMPTEMCLPITEF